MRIFFRKKNNKAPITHTFDYEILSQLREEFFLFLFEYKRQMP